MASLLDKLPSYELERRVIIKSARIAAIYYVLVIVLAGGSLFGFYLNKSYNDYSQLKGVTFVSLQGSGKSAVGVVQDSVDLRYPGVEPDSVFIMTHISSIYGQLRHDPTTSKSVCQSDVPCKNSSDCTDDKPALGELTGICLPGKQCEMRGWCPAVFPKGETTYFIEENLKVKIDTSLYFPTLNRSTFSTKTYVLKDLLSLAGVKYTEVREKGAVLLFSMYFECSSDDLSNCPSQVTIRRLDKTQLYDLGGFEAVRANYNSDKNSDGSRNYYRDLHRMNGIRLVFVVNGKFATFSFVKVLLGVGSAIGLVGLATSLTEKAMGFFEGKKYESSVNVDVDKEQKELAEMCRKVVREELRGRKVVDTGFSAIKGAKREEAEETQAEAEPESIMDDW